MILRPPPFKRSASKPKTLLAINAETISESDLESAVTYEY